MRNGCLGPWGLAAAFVSNGNRSKTADSTTGPLEASGHYLRVSPVGMVSWTGGCEE